VGSCLGKARLGVPPRRSGGNNGRARGSVGQPSRRSSFRSGRSVGWTPPVAAIMYHTHCHTGVPPYIKCHMARPGQYKYKYTGWLAGDRRILFSASALFIVSCRVRLRHENGHMGCVRLLPNDKPFPPRLGLRLKSHGEYGYECVIRFGRPTHL
jgi:hypothetical protein